MSDITVNAYILYAFMAFQSLLLLALLGAVLRMLFLMGRMQGEINGLRESLQEQINGTRESLQEQINGTRESLQGQINGLRDAVVALTARVERLEEQLANLREEVAEIRGSLRALHERVGLIMRHRHDEQTGAVILTPTEPSTEPVPDPAAN